MSWSEDRTWPWCRARVASRRYSVGVRTIGSAVDRDLLVGEVDVQGAVVEGRDRVAPGHLPATDGLEAGQQLNPAERLRQVVVRPRIETPHLVSLGP